MKWSRSLGHIYGTEVRLHLSLALLIPYAIWQFRPTGLTDGLYTFLFLLVLFVCVFLHELGHAVAARAYGLPVERIVLWFLGGYAQLGREPERPMHDLLIAAAGPGTNLVLMILSGALGTFAFLPLMLWPGEAELVMAINSGFISFFSANMVLALFNLIPIYPLDGGRMLHAGIQIVAGQRSPQTARPGKPVRSAQHWGNLVTTIIGLPLVVLLGIGAFLIRDYVLLGVTVLLGLGTLTLNQGMLRRLVRRWVTTTNRGIALVLQEDYDRALEWTNARIARKPKDAIAYNSRGIAHLNTDNLAQARADFARARELRPRMALPIINHGYVAYLQGDYEQALADYNRAIEVAPRFAITYSNRAEVFQALGDAENATADYDQAIALDPNDARLYSIRARWRYLQGDVAGARADEDQALNRDPAEALLCDEYDLALHIRGNLAWAHQFYSRVLAQGIHMALAYQGRADAYRVNEHGSLAVADYSRAMEYEPHKAELYLGRGKAYLLLGAVEQAVADFRQAVSLSSRGHLRRAAEAWLQRLEALQQEPPAAPAHPPSPARPATLA
jgi:Flp pilus assembly protein TadD/Zn-dependent protease